MRPAIHWRLKACYLRLWDWWHDVETAAGERLEDMSTIGPNRAYAVPYQRSSPRRVRELIQTLGIAYSTYSFVDIGSGKGGVLLTAATFPFQDVVGVEFTRELHNLANQNIQKARWIHWRAPVVRSVHADATMFDFPQVPLVIFMFNPFAAVVLAKVLENLGHSLAVNPRDCLLIATGNWMPQSVLAATRWLTEIRATQNARVYQADLSSLPLPGPVPRG
jgi:SAM-dependent methyltransferase